VCLARRPVTVPHGHPGGLGTPPPVRQAQTRWVYSCPCTVVTWEKGTRPLHRVTIPIHAQQVVVMGGGVIVLLSVFSESALRYPYTPAPFPLYMQLMPARRYKP
jgi:hypothetical protein